MVFLPSGIELNFTIYFGFERNSPSLSVSILQQVFQRSLWERWFTEPRNIEQFIVCLRPIYPVSTEYRAS